METKKSWSIALLLMAFLMMTAGYAAIQGGGQTAQAADPMEGRVMAPSKYGFDETVSRVKQAIEGQQMMVVFTADHQAMLQMVGMKTKGMQAIEFFHPRYGKIIFENDHMAGIEPPLKIVVMEGDMGTMISYYKPSHTFARYPKLKSLGEELDRVYASIQAAVAK